MFDTFKLYAVGAVGVIISIFAVLFKMRGLKIESLKKNIESKKTEIKSIRESRKQQQEAMKEGTKLRKVYDSYREDYEQIHEDNVSIVKGKKTFKPSETTKDVKEDKEIKPKDEFGQYERERIQYGL